MNPDVDTDLPPELVGHARSKDGRLANAGRPEQHSHARGHQVRGDYLAVSIAPEEERRIDSGVFERG
jgi:hypothetical protein